MASDREYQDKIITAQYVFGPFFLKHFRKSNTLRFTILAQNRWVSRVGHTGAVYRLLHVLKPYQVLP